MGNSLRTFYVGLEGLSVADRAKVEELISRVSSTHSYDVHGDAYRVITSITPEEFRALPWPDGCMFRV